MTATPKRGFELYYLAATPVFFALDRFWGLSIRAAFLDGWPAARYGYYAVCFGGGVWAWRAPSMTRVIAITESSANLVLLIFSVMLNYYAMIDRVAADQALGAGFGPRYAVNLVIAAAAFSLAYFRSLNRS